MPKVDGLSKEQRKALMADASDDAEPIDLPEPVKATPVVPVAAAAPTDMAALIQMLASAMNQNGQTQATAIKEALADATAMARTPIPENQVAPGVSVYGHPDGDVRHPRTKLKCPMFLSVYDENRKAVGAFEYHPDTLTEWERVHLNKLEPGSFWVERNDGTRAIALVVEQKDDLGQPIRMLLAVPQGWLAKDQFAQMPSLKSFLTQLLEREPATAAA
jgi:hypothetical protein